MNTRIICLEGIIGAGKTTQIERLHKKLQPLTNLVPELNQFSPLKEVIAKWKRRTIESAKVEFTRGEIEELALARAQTQKTILSSLPESPYLLTERSIYTAAVYETGGLEQEEILDINKRAGVISPDWGFILDCEPNEALRRVEKRRKEEGLYLSPSIHENLHEMTKRRQLYLNLTKINQELILIDANQSKEEVFKRIISYF